MFAPVKDAINHIAVVFTRPLQFCGPFISSTTKCTCASSLAVACLTLFTLDANGTSLKLKKETKGMGVRK